MYHYEGSRWQGRATDSLGGREYCGRTIELAQVFGFLSTDISPWVGNRTDLSPRGPLSSLIIHFNGNSWSEMSVPDGGMLNAVWGVYSGEMWAAGVAGTIYHYIGFAWQA